MRSEAGISHPSDAVNADECNDAGFKDLGIANVLSLNFADEKNNSGDEKHNHLDNGGHGDSLHIAFSVWEMGQEFREIT